MQDENCNTVYDTKCHTSYLHKPPENCYGEKHCQVKNSWHFNLQNVLSGFNCYVNHLQKGTRFFSLNGIFFWKYSSDNILIKVETFSHDNSAYFPLVNNDICKRMVHNKLATFGTYLFISQFLGLNLRLIAFRNCGFYCPFLKKILT